MTTGQLMFFGGIVLLITATIMFVVMAVTAKRERKKLDEYLKARY